jgi:hypothetical protein
MIDVDARGRHEAELLREEAARIADTESALQSVLDGVVLVPLVAHREAPPRVAVTRRPVSVRRRMAVLVGVAAAVAVVAVLAFRPSNEPGVVPTATTVVPSSTELVVRPLDPPIECELELCPSLAVSPEGTLVAYDQAAKTLTWYDTEPHVVPVTADLDAEHVQLVATAIGGPNNVVYLVSGSPDTQSWELVTIAGSGAELQRQAIASPDVELSARGLSERYCWSGCEPATRLLMPWEDGPYPDISYTTGTVQAVFGGLRWTIAWPDPLSTRSQAGQRWDGGAVLSLVPESADAPSELIELLPDGSVQRFGLGDQTVHALLPDGSAVVWRDGQLVRLSPEWPGALAPEFTAQTLEPPIACKGSPWNLCPELAFSPDGTLVAWDTMAQTLTWYEHEPRVVPLKAEPPHAVDEDLHLIAIGPHDIAYYIMSLAPRGYVIAAVAPSGTEITRMDWQTGAQHVFPTATGIVGPQSPENGEWPPPNSVLVMPWVDLDGNPITDTRPYPTAKNTDAGIEVRLGDRRWLLAGEALSGDRDSDSWWPRHLLARSDGGVVMALDWNGPSYSSSSNETAQQIKLLELLPDGTIEQYGIARAMLPRVGLLSSVLPDGSLLVQHNLQLVRLTPPA